MLPLKTFWCSNHEKQKTNLRILHDIRSCWYIHTLVMTSCQLPETVNHPSDLQCASDGSPLDDRRLCRCHLSEKYTLSSTEV